MEALFSLQVASCLFRNVSDNYVQNNFQHTYDERYGAVRADQDERSQNGGC